VIRIATLALLLLPVQVQALSCLPHSVETAFTDAVEAEGDFVIVRGALKFDTRKLPKVDWARQSDTPPLTQIEAVLNGKSLTSAGFAIPFDRKVTLEIACFGPWCAKPLSGSDVIAFVERRTEGFVVAANPCGGFLFDTPKPAVIRKLKACFAGKTCDAAFR